MTATCRRPASRRRTRRARPSLAGSDRLREGEQLLSAGQSDRAGVCRQDSEACSWPFRCQGAAKAPRRSRSRHIGRRPARWGRRLVSSRAQPQAAGMFMVDAETAAAIRRAWDEGGELSAVVELRRHFPLISDGDNARRCVRASSAGHSRPPRSRNTSRSRGEGA